MTPALGRPKPSKYACSTCLDRGVVAVDGGRVSFCSCATADKARAAKPEADAILREMDARDEADRRHAVRRPGHELYVERQAWGSIPRTRGPVERVSAGRMEQIAAEPKMRDGVRASQCLRERHTCTCGWCGPWFQQGWLPAIGGAA